MRRKQVPILALAAVLLCCFACGGAGQGVAPKVVKIEKRTAGPLTVIVVGDLMLDDLALPYIKKYGYGYPLAAVRDFLSGADVVVANLETAVARVKHYAAPINSVRFGMKNPCTETGLCADCRSPQRICNMWSTIEGHMIKDRIHVKLVGENLGY